MNAKTKKSLFVGIMSVMLASCGLSEEQRKALVRFSDASNSVSRLASDEFVFMREQTIRMNKDRLVHLGRLSERAGPNDLDEFFDPITVASRIHALDALRSLANGLASLAVDDSPSAANALTSFSYELSALSPGLGMSASPELGKWGKRFANIANKIGERQRQEEIKEIALASGLGLIVCASPSAYPSLRTIPRPLIAEARISGAGKALAADQITGRFSTMLL